MSENGLSFEIEKKKEIQNALRKYGASINKLCLEYPIQSNDPPTYETPRYDIEEPDGNPIQISYSYFPEGMENIPTVKYTTIIVDKVLGLGGWVKNYHIHEMPDRIFLWEKTETFIIDSNVNNALEGALPASTLNDEMASRLKMERNTADLKAYLAHLAEAIYDIKLEEPSLNEVALLQGYINQLI